MSPSTSESPDPASPVDGAQPAASKPELRRHFRARRQAALAASEAAILAAAVHELPDRLRPGLRLGIAWPLRGEVDLRPLALHRLPLALPAVVPDPASPSGARLLYRDWRPGEPVAADHCGVPAPLPGSSAFALAPECLGLLLVPALAFDPRTGIRLGYGGGWYDRLRADPAWRAVTALAVLPSACLMEGLPRDPWDVPLDGWLDDQGLHRTTAAAL